jgi:hypothetical protein
MPPVIDRFVCHMVLPFNLVVFMFVLICDPLFHVTCTHVVGALGTLWVNPNRA